MSRNHLAGIPMRRQATGGGVAPTYYYRVPIMNYSSGPYSNTTTTFVTPGGVLSSASASTTREQTEIEIGAAGYIKRLRCFVTTTTLAATATLKLYVNGVDQSATHSVTIASGTAGTFEMSTDDGFAVSAGDLVTIEIVRTEASSLPLANVGFDYLTTTGNVILVASQSGSYNQSAGQLRFQAVVGANGQNTNSTLTTRITIPAACTIKKVSTYVTTNGRTTDTQFYVRINGGGVALASGTAAAGVGSTRLSATGSVAVSAGDDLEFVMDGGNDGVSNTIAWTVFQVELEPAVAGKTSIVTSYAASAIGAGITRYRSAAGQGSNFASATESISTTRFKKGGTARNMYAVCFASTALNNTNYYLRPGGVDSALTVQFFPSASDVPPLVKDTVVAGTSATIADNETVTIKVAQDAGGAGNHTAGWQSYQFEPTAETI